MIRPFVLLVWPGDDGRVEGRLQPHSTAITVSREDVVTCLPYRIHCIIPVHTP